MSIVPYKNDDYCEQNKIDEEETKIKTKIVTLHELREKRRRLKNKQKETYSWLISRCNQQIIKSNSVKCKETIFNIPEMYYGNPRIDVREAAKYLLKILKKEGFIASYQEPGNIYISWNVSKEKYKRSSSKHNKNKIIPQQPSNPPVSEPRKPTPNNNVYDSDSSYTSAKSKSFYDSSISVSDFDESSISALEDLDTLMNPGHKKEQDDSDFN